MTMVATTAAAVAGKIAAGVGAAAAFETESSGLQRCQGGSVRWSYGAMERRRRKMCIVAASPPRNDAVLSVNPLTKQDLVAYLASGCKPKEKWRYVWFGFFHVGLCDAEILVQ